MEWTGSSRCATSVINTPLPRQASSAGVRSLFIRIFLWFWAATVLLVAVLIGTVYLTEPDVQTPHWRSLTRSFLNLYSQDAASRYELHGCAGLQSFFERHEPFPE